MVAAAGEHWPDGWVRGAGFVPSREDADPMVAPPIVGQIGEEYVARSWTAPPASASATSTSCAYTTPPGTPQAKQDQERGHRRNPDRASPLEADRAPHGHAVGLFGVFHQVSLS
jgi:hypothetical protein